MEGKGQGNFHLTTGHEGSDGGGRITLHFL
jgi:hypothetical protein